MMIIESNVSSVGWSVAHAVYECIQNGHVYSFDMIVWSYKRN